MMSMLYNDLGQTDFFLAFVQYFQRDRPTFVFAFSNVPMASYVMTVRADVNNEERSRKNIMVGYQVEHQPSDFVVAILNAGI